MNNENKLRYEYFLESWYKHLKDDRKKLNLSDIENNYSRDAVEQLSGKIYNYLKKGGVGRNDFVLIDMPRSSKIFITLIGIAKAGAAFVIVENELGKERKKYIQEDIHCKLVINEELFSNFNSMEYIEGYEPTDVHDAAFAIYTSGTTGTPKGVIHEYGNYEML